MSYCAAFFFLSSGFLFLSRLQAFGRMTVGASEFASDPILHQDGRVQANWWRQQGHNLVPGDIEELLEESPAQIIVGTGHDGLMSVSPRVSEACRQRKIEVETLPTAQSVVRYNEEIGKKVPVAACFHLTC
jgi:hypothetical protein